MSDFDMIVIGTAPADATAALILARRGVRVIGLENAKTPRFHIGESTLPRNCFLDPVFSYGALVARRNPFSMLGEQPQELMQLWQAVATT